MADDSSTTLSASSLSPPTQTFQFIQQQVSPPSNRSSTLLDNSTESAVSDGGGSGIYEKNVPYVNFYCRSNTNSEIIEERVIYLDKPCKIGRSVAKIKPEVNNAIFDCKVLSRNHALLWYENSKVLISKA